jgi:thioester reductase-like protein
LKHVFLTGATGLVGQYLLRNLLLANQPTAVLIRPQSRISAQQRLISIVEFWEKTLSRSLPRPVCLEGDITTDGLGLKPDERNWLRDHTGMTLHNAASLVFYGKDRTREPWLSNFNGTANVLNLCEELKLRELHYVSTAYVCGKRPGPILETEFDLGQGFRNDYEECKFAAEQLVRTSSFLDRTTIYRPGIIVGDSQTGYTATYHGVYAYFQFIWMFLQFLPQQPDGRYFHEMRINLTGDEIRNLVPVDWVADVMSWILLNPEHHGQTYHLTPRQPLTARDIHEATVKYFNYYGPHFAGRDGLRDGNLNDLERLFYEHLDRYQPYWHEEPTFDCQNTLRVASHLPCPPLDDASLGRMMDYAVLDRWGKRKKN